MPVFTMMMNRGESFSDFGQALGHVEEGGTLYLGKPADITKSFPIDRSLTIRS